MEKIEVTMYPSEKAAAIAMRKYIMKSSFALAERVWFKNSPEIYDITPCGLRGEFEWYGDLDAIQVTDITGEKVLFASWFETGLDIEFDEFFYNFMSLIDLKSN